MRMNGSINNSETRPQHAPRRDTVDRRCGLASAIILAWNGECHLHEAIDYMSAQTCPHLAVFFVDDGHTDRMASVA